MFIARTLGKRFGSTRAVADVSFAVEDGRVLTLLAGERVFDAARGALATMDSGFEEAARVAGASRWTLVRRVTLPLITPSLAAAAVFSFIIAWGLFATPAILGMPARIYVFATQLSRLLNSFPPKLGPPAALAVVFCPSALLVGLGM